MLQNTNIRPPPEENVAATPTDLKILRLLLGLSAREVGSLIGTTEQEAQLLERRRTLFMYLGHGALLEQMLARVNTLLGERSGDAAPAPEFLFTYPNDDVFKEYDPALSGWMHFNSVHTMFQARLLDEWMQRDHRPIMAEIVPTQYEEYLRTAGQPDSVETRTTWARGQLKSISTRPGFPRAKPGQIKTEAMGGD